MEMLANKPDSEGKREVFVLEIMIVNHMQQDLADF